MAQFIIVPIFFAIAIVGMGLALHFSKYKQGDAGCCGGGHCSADGHGHGDGNHSCYSSKSDFVDDYTNLKKVKVLNYKKK